MTTVSNFSPYKLIKEALKTLKPNEQKVISGRFGIDSPRRTLSSIGRELKLSRERIRQIEREALRKLASEIISTDNANIIKIVKAIETNGGVVRHDKIGEKFLDSAYRDDKNEFNSLHLIFFVYPQLKKIEKTKELEESWILGTLTREDVLSVIEDWVKHLRTKKSPQTIEVLLKDNPHHTKYDLTFLSELPSVSKKVVKTESGHIGLAEWPEVNPKNVRDKIYFILKKENTPIHFDTIAKKINDSNFGKRKVVKATVHNELIADKRFVLVGRGIYALTEWGYKPGTVKEVIREILESSPKGMPASSIISEVLKKRTVKKNTVLINLQTKPDFKKLSKDVYTLAAKN